MQRKGSLTEIQTDELLDNLDSLSENQFVGQNLETKRYKRVLDFVTKFNLQPGTNLVPFMLLIEIYKTTFGRINVKMFKACLKELFDAETIDKRVYFKLTDNIVQITSKYKEFNKLKEEKLNKLNTKDMETVERFIKQFNVKKGTDDVPLFVIYYFFNKYRNTRSFGYKKFRKLLKKHISTKVRSAHFKINLMLFKESIKEDGEYEKAKAYAEKETQKLIQQFKVQKRKS